MRMGSIVGLLVVAVGFGAAALSGCSEEPAVGGKLRPSDPRFRLDAGVRGVSDGEPATGPDGAGGQDVGAEEDARGGRDADSADQGAREVDSGLGRDSGGGADRGALGDSGALDSGVRPDSGALPDTGVLADTGVAPDSGVAPDTGVAPDSGVRPDSGLAPDSGVPGNGDVWLQIDYSAAHSPQSPSWSFSSTPGFGSPQWAFTGHNGPEAWDRFNNMSVVSDPIGRVLEIGGGSQLQLMFGLTTLSSYRSISVRIEGRSRATSSGVTFDVLNPLNGCGTSGRTSQDWTVHVIELDLATCAVVGGGVQAVRVAPTNGTLALVRMRVTLHGAVY